MQEISRNLWKWIHIHFVGEVKMAKKKIKKEEIKEEVTEEQGQLDLMDILNKLVPPESIEIVDIFGNSYSKASVLSARKQIKVVREFEKVISFVAEDKIDIESSADIIDFLIRSATNETVLEHLGSCFTIAFEDVVEQSVEYAQEKGISLDEENPTLDLFALEDLVGAIVPLFIRLAKKLVGAITKLTKM